MHVDCASRRDKSPKLDICRAGAMHSTALYKLGKESMFAKGMLMIQYRQHGCMWDAPPHSFPELAEIRSGERGRARVKAPGLLSLSHRNCTPWKHKIRDIRQWNAV